MTTKNNTPNLELLTVQELRELIMQCSALLIEKEEACRKTEQKRQEKLIKTMAKTVGLNVTVTFSRPRK